MRGPLPYALVLALCFGGAGKGYGQSRTGGMLLPDTLNKPMITLEKWDGLPKGYKLPARVDLSQWFPPAGDQGGQEACVTWAMCYGLMSYRNNRWDGRTYKPRDTVDSANTFSPSYLYNTVKGFSMRLGQRDSSLCDDGTDIERMFDFCSLGGSCSLKEMPYDTAFGSCTARPRIEAIIHAIPNHTPPAIMLDATFNADQWRYHLAHGRPIVAGIVVDQVFLDSGYAAAGVRDYIWGWEPRGPDLFGHAMVCTGYEDDSTFTFLNSWGQQWGHQGYVKATLMRLTWRCYAGYVLSNDSTATWASKPGRPADGDHDTGPVVKEALDPGEYQHINDKKINLASLDTRDRHAVLQVFDAGSDSLARNITMRLGQPYVVYSGEERLELSLDRKSLAGRILGNDVRCTVITNTTKEDPLLRQRNATISRLRNALPEDQRSTQK